VHDDVFTRLGEASARLPVDTGLHSRRNRGDVKHSERQFLDLIDALYEGMLDEPAWNAALVRLTDFVSGSALILFSANPSTGQVFRSDVARADAKLVADYLGTWIRDDPRHVAGLTCKVGEPQIDGMLVQTREYHRSSIFNEFLRPADVPFHLATWLERTPSRGVVLTINGSWKRGAFNEEERARMSVLVPHMRRIVAMKDRMARAQMHANGMLEIMDRLPYGVVLLGPDLEILDASIAARTVLSARSGVHADGTRFGFVRSTDARAFARHLNEDPARARLNDAMMISRGPLRPPLALLVLPLKPTQQPWLRPAARWLLLIFDPEIAPSVAEHALRTTFGFTAAEAALASRLALGLTVAQAAAQLGISVNTARTQLKAAFSKADVRTQAQLVRRILNSPASIARREAPRRSTLAE
jgi:DNA-binding CsgD family transcriptional regulator